jgi:hypothetical protein
MLKFNLLLILFCECLHIFKGFIGYISMIYSAVWWVGTVTEHILLFIAFIYVSAQ